MSADKMLIAEKIIVAKDALQELFHSVSNLPIEATASQARDNIKVEIARITAMLESIGEQLRAERAN